MFPLAPPQPASVVASLSPPATAPRLLAQAIAPNGAGTRVEVQGNQVTIDGGTPAGNNLFHSFERFGLAAGQTATFVAHPTLENILGRINGGDRSVIDGTLQMSGGSANLFLINPAGWVFGPNAQLNLPAAFTVGTSDRLRFGNSIFEIFGPNDYSQLLENPDGFVFSSSDPAGILNQAVLSLTPGQQLSLIAGSITSSGQLNAPNGRVTVVAAPGRSTVRRSDGTSWAIQPMAAPEQLPPSFSPTPLLQHSSATADPTVLPAGMVALQQLEANQATISASGDVILHSSQLQTQTDLTVVAGDRLSIRDSNTAPLVVQAGGHLVLQGNQSLDILALSNPQTEIRSSGDLSLISDRPISADAHFNSGGNFRLGSTNGGVSPFISLYDPIIRAAGNVSFGDYNGTALKVEAGGSIATGNITITGPDALTIPVTDPDFVELTTLPSLILRAGTPLGGPASALPLASGGTTFEGSPSPDPGASIAIAGDVDTTASSSPFPTAAGNITLSAPGSITAGALNASLTNDQATGDPLKGGQIRIDAGGAIALGDLSTAVSSISSGDLTAGNIQITSLGDMQVGAIDSSAAGRGAFAQAQAGTVSLEAGGNLQLTSLDARGLGANVGGEFPVVVGQGGDVSLVAQGNLQISDRVPASSASIETTGRVTSGTIALSHGGGPDNLPFRVGDSSVNGSAGDLVAGAVISSNEAFASLGKETRGPNGEISVTFTNTAPELGGGKPISGVVNQPLAIALADLNLVASDADGDTLRLELASISGGSLSRNGQPLAPGDTLVAAETLSFQPDGAVGVPPGFSLRASDGVSVSQALPIPLELQQQPPKPPRPPQVNPGLDPGYLLRSRPLLDIPLAERYTETRLLGMPLMPAPAVVELTAIRGILPEAHLLMLPVATWNMTELNTFDRSFLGNTLGLLEIGGSAAAQNKVPLSGSADGFDINFSGFIDIDGNLINSVDILGNGVLGNGVLGNGVLGNDFDIRMTGNGSLSTGNFAITSTPPGEANVLPPGLQTEPFNPFGAGGLGAFPSTAQPISLPTPAAAAANSPPVPTSLPVGPSGLGPDVNPGAAATLGTDSLGPDTPSDATPTGPIATGLPGEATPGAAPTGPSEPAANSNASSNASTTGSPTATALDCPQQVAQVRQTKAGDRKQPIYQALIKCFQQNLVVAQQSQNHPLQLYALNNLGSAYFVVGDYLQAIAAHEQQLTAAQLTGDRTHIGIALAGLGAAQAALGDYDAAIAQYQRSLAALPQDKALQWRGLALRNLGNAYLSQKNYTQALAYQTESLKLSQAIKDTYGEMQSLGNLGNAHTLNAEFDPALQAYEKSLALAQQLGAELEEAQTLLGMATTYSYQKRYELAIAYAQQSLLSLQQLENRLGQGIALTNLGDAQYQIGQIPPAEASFRQGIQVWESLRAGLGNNDAYKISIFETQRAAYRNLQEVLADQNKVIESLEVAERSRGRAFVELLARGNAQSRLQSQTQAIVPPNIAELQRIAREQNATLVEYTLAQEQFVDTPYGATVQYASEPQDSKVLIWVVSPSGQVNLRQVDLRQASPQTSLLQLVQLARRCMNDPFCVRLAQRQTRFGFQAPELERLAPSESEASRIATSPAAETPGAAASNPLHQLHQLLIAPIADLLPASDSEKVIFIPQDHLFLTPFPALQAADGSYLIDRHTVLTSPSIQLLGATRARRQQLGDRPTPALVVGNPAPMPGNFSPLPFTEVEAKNIAERLNAQALTGLQASEAQVKQQLGQANLIHFATHGTFDATKPLDGAIALAPSDREDGLLTAAELLNTQINAHLVVLSACDTGRGRITGDGVVGLSRAFLAAGASSVMVSLWQVPDDATASLMSEFYRQRQQQSTNSGLGQAPNNAQALRQAMLTLKDIYPDPKAWSGFTLIGESQ